MAGPNVRTSGVTVIIEPPIDFILRQSAEFRAALLDLDPLWELVKPVVAETEKQQFETAGHGEWPALAPVTLEIKERHGWPLDPLVRTGDLKNSLTDPGRAADTGPRHMIWSTDVEYARFHQTGTKHMPMRQPVPDPYPVEERRKVEAAMVTYINQAAHETWGTI